MSQANFDHFTIDETGVETDGSIEHGAFSVAVFKNRLHLRDPEGWREEHGYCYPIVGDVYGGLVTWGGFMIYAEIGAACEMLFLVARNDVSGEMLGVNTMLGYCVSNSAEIDEAGLQKHLRTKFLTRARGELSAHGIWFDAETIAAMKGEQ